MMHQKKKVLLGALSNQKEWNVCFIQVAHKGSKILQKRRSWCVVMSRQLSPLTCNQGYIWSGPLWARFFRQATLINLILKKYDLFV